MIATADLALHDLPGSLEDKTNRLPMSHPIFSRLEEMVKTPASSMQWYVCASKLTSDRITDLDALFLNRFGMAEQALNAIYLLGEQPDVLAGRLIKNFTVRTFDAANPDVVAEGLEGLTLDEMKARAEGSLSPQSTTKSLDEVDASASDAEGSQAPDVAASERSGPGLKKSTSLRSLAGSDFVSSFELGQLIFIVGHVAIKQIVYLEVVERELKRRKEEQAAAGESDRGFFAQQLLPDRSQSRLRSQSSRQVQGCQRSRPGLR